MANLITTDTELTSVASAIRAKTGGTAQLEYPAEFISEIGDIVTIGDAVTENLTAANIKAGVTVKVGDADDDDSVASVTGEFTSDADATEADILSGKSAYVNGVKVDGSYTLAGATSDADAAAGDIVSGKTAYVNGSKITGNLVPLDTSDANATAADIASGKTAYVNGSKITGEYSPKINGVESITSIWNDLEFQFILNSGRTYYSGTTMLQVDLSSKYLIKADGAQLSLSLTNGVDASNFNIRTTTETVDGVEYIRTVKVTVKSQISSASINRFGYLQFQNLTDSYRVDIV